MPPQKPAPAPAAVVKSARAPGAEVAPAPKNRQRHWHINCPTPIGTGTLAGEPTLIQIPKLEGQSNVKKHTLLFSQSQTNTTIEMNEKSAS